MPIAELLVEEAILRAAEAKSSELAGLVQEWAEAAGCASDHMTITVRPFTRQVGRSLDVIAYLDLPDLWPPERREALQLGLGTVCCRVFSVRSERVQVLTRVYASGCVSDGQKIERW